MAKRAVIFLAEGFEETEAVTTIDVLRRAGIEVTVVGVDTKTVKASRGVVVKADILLTELDNDRDAYILPGGMPGAANLANNESIGKMLLQAQKADKLIAAICASPAIVLNPLSILKGKSATCYPGMEKDFGPDIHYTTEAVVVDGSIITSRGPATAMRFALAIVEKLVGKDTATKVGQGLLMI